MVVNKEKIFFDPAKGFFAIKTNFFSYITKETEQANFFWKKKIESRVKIANAGETKLGYDHYWQMVKKLLYMYASIRFTEY